MELTILTCLVLWYKPIGIAAEVSRVLGMSMQIKCTYINNLLANFFCLLFFIHSSGMKTRYIQNLSILEGTRPEWRVRFPQLILKSFMSTCYVQN